MCIRDRDGHEDEGGMVFADRQHDLHPLEQLERIREGIDDYRYLKLMVDLARQNPDSAASREALAFYKQILEKAAFEHTREGRSAKMNDAELDAMRRKAADFIGRLMKQVAVAPVPSEVETRIDAERPAPVSEETAGDRGALPYAVAGLAVIIVGMALLLRGKRRPVGSRKSRS